MQTNNSSVCFYSTTYKCIFTAWFGVYLLFLPIFLYVLYIGYKRCRNHRSAFISSHSDVITFYMVALELCSIVFSCLYCIGLYMSPSIWSLVAGSAMSMCVVGQALFHCLTCMEHYMAVVQPITYLRLRKKRGVTIRNICIGWVCCSSLVHTYLTNVAAIQPVYNITAAFMLAGFSLTVTGFCSISIICVLTRPGPGKRGRDRRIVDQSKRSAFETVVTILAVLLLRFFAFLVANFLHFTKQLSEHTCTITFTSLWFSLPSSLVLPLLFLHRAGKLTWFKTKKAVAHLPSKVQGSNAIAGIA